MMKNIASMTLGDQATTLSPDNAVRLTAYVEEIIDSHNRNDFKQMLMELLMLRELVLDQVEPETLSLSFVDFLMDEKMWEWISETIKKDDLNLFDKQAAAYIVADLQDLIAGKTFARRPNMDA